MKTYETPELKVVKFDVKDIIATSNDEGFVPGENGTGFLPNTKNLMS